MTKIQNLNIEKLIPLISPAKLKQELPGSGIIYRRINQYRDEIKNILLKKDKRMLAIVGPCSIHNVDEALEYAEKLKALQVSMHDRLFIMMRVYFEKPRTTIGWKGIINDPDLDNTHNMSKGLRTARKLLLDIADLGLPVATEMLDPISPQYTSDLVSWASLGARTSESQTHREMASGLSMPIGFKNGTDGGLDVAVGAIKSAGHPHSFLGIDKNGTTVIVKTKGNVFGHLILRGGKNGPNFDEESIKCSVEKLKHAGEKAVLVVDCSHGNSEKKHVNQPGVLRNIVAQVKRGNTNIVGFMLESNLEAGSQKISADLSKMEYGISVTDECMNWVSTKSLLEEVFS
ncbi:MAG: 3-deoxy-7-phosphoheptulonate synthase [Nitrospinota bacterium]